MIDEYHRRHPGAPGPHPKLDEYDDNKTAAAVLWVAGICSHTVAGGELEETAPGSAVELQAESYRDKAGDWGDAPAHGSPITTHTQPRSMAQQSPFGQQQPIAVVDTNGVALRGASLRSDGKPYAVLAQLCSDEWEDG